MYSYSSGKNRDNSNHFVDFTILFSERHVCKTVTETKLFKLIGKSDCKVSRDVQPNTITDLVFSQNQIGSKKLTYYCNQSLKLFYVLPRIDVLN